MARRKIRIGVAGLGRIGWKWHCAELNRHAGFELAAVQDVASDRLREAAQTYGVTTYSSFADMLADARLEAVTIATPSHLHAEMARQALAAGCHTMVEKPMAVDSEEAGAMVRAAARRGRVLTVYQSLRAFAYWQHLETLLGTGLIGHVYHVRLASYRFVRRDDWQSLSRYGGGVLNNAGSHLLDQLLQVIGYDVTRVYGNLKRIATLGDAEDFVKMVVETKRGVIGELDINSACPVGGPPLQIWGTCGSIALAPDQASFSVLTFRPAALPAKQLSRALASRDRRYPTDEIPVEETVVPVDAKYEVNIYGRFATAIRTGCAPFVRPQEPLAVMKLIDRCRKESRRVQRLVR